MHVVVLFKIKFHLRSKAAVSKTKEKAYYYEVEETKCHDHSLKDDMLLVPIILVVLKFLHHHKVFETRVNQKVQEANQNNQNDQAEDEANHKLGL